MKPLKNLGAILAALAVFGSFGLLIGNCRLAARHDAKVRTVAAEWLSARGNIWPGVTLYYGPNRIASGTVVTADTETVTINMGGSHERKNRAWVVSNYWVRAHDPALHR